MRVCIWFLFFFKQKTAYEMRISDWSSDVCSSDLDAPPGVHEVLGGHRRAIGPDTVAQLEGIGLAILADGPALRCAGDRLTILAVGQQAEEHIVGQAAGLHCGDVVRVHRLWFAVIADAQHLLGLSGTAYREREANAERRVLGRVLEWGEKIGRAHV